MVMMVLSAQYPQRQSIWWTKPVSLFPCWGDLFDFELTWSFLKVSQKNSKAFVLSLHKKEVIELFRFI